MPDALITTMLHLANVYWGGRYTGAAGIVLVVVGLGVAFNSLKAMRSGEGMFDEESRTRMQVINPTLVAVGLALAAVGIYLVCQLFTRYGTL